MLHHQIVVSARQVKARNPGHLAQDLAVTMAVFRKCKCHQEQDQPHGVSQMVAVRPAQVCYYITCNYSPHALFTASHASVNGTTSTRLALSSLLVRRRSRAQARCMGAYVLAQVETVTSMSVL